MRKILSWIVLFLISLFLSLLIIVWLFFYRIGDPNTFKQTLSSSGAYQGIIDIAPKLISDNQNQELSLSEQELSSVLKVAFSENDLLQISEKIIDDFYAWFKGTSSSFVINIDFAPYKAKTEPELVYAIKNHFENLPECSQSELIKISQNANLESLKCQPKDIISSIDFSQSAKETISNIPSSINYSVSEQARDLPMLYQIIIRSMNSMVVLLVLLFSLLIALMWNEPRSLMRRIGSIFLQIGIPIVVFWFIADYFYQNQLSSSLSSFSNVPVGISEIILKISTLLVELLNQSLLKIGIICSIVGAITFLISYIFPKKKT